MTEQPKRTVEEFIQDLEKFSLDGDAVATDINLVLEAVTQALDGKLSYWVCSTKNTEHKKIVIEYDHVKQNRQNT